jgi:hypothetical protein
MTEQEWLQAADPRPMLGFLQGRASERKIRLFLVACCRRIWHLLTDKRSKQMVEVVEQFADGICDQAAVGKAKAAAWAARVTFPSWAARAAYEASLHSLGTARAAGRAVKVHHGEKKWYAEMQAQASLIRDLLGPLPFRPVTLDPVWRIWHGGLLVSMAQRMYDNRDFSDMPVLSDALEEAGCDNADILAHCRGPGPHTRGCWPVDLVLGKM